MELDARLEGWLYIAFGLESGYTPATLTWHRRYCVLEPNLKKFYVLKDEQSATAVSNSAVVRLDDDCKNDSDSQEEVFHKPLDEVFDAGTRLTQIQQYRISKRIKSSGVRLSTRNTSTSRESPVSEKATAILGMSRAQSVNNGFDRNETNNETHSANPNPMVWTVYLGSDSPPLIRVVHQSLSGREHTYCVETSKRSVYLACRSDLELNRWIDSLTHVVDPLKEERVQRDQLLTVWIVEAKHLSKKRYFVEVFLDSMFCCRTVTKLLTEMLFWGENFNFWDLKAFRKIRIVLRRENKNKKACIVGEVDILVKDLTLGQEYENWYNLGNGSHSRGGASVKSSASVKDPQIRVKVKLQTLTVLPLNCYESLLTYLASKSINLCTILEEHLSVRHKEELASLLLRVLQDFQKAREFLEEIVMQEVDQTEDPSLMFRGNSIATKAVDIYMKLIGAKYLKNTLGLFVRDIYDNAQEFEVDITRMATGEDYTTNQQNMRMYVDKAWALILSSYPKFPPDLRELFARVKERCEQVHRPEISRKLISGSIFLRFFCPAIMSPSLFNLTDEYPDEKTGRCLILTAKVIQNLANFTKFGGKEEYMSFMNEFVETSIPNMDLFISKISEPMDTEFKTAELYNSNIGSSLASLHAFLAEKMGSLSEEQRLSLEKLPAIIADLDEHCANIPNDNLFPYNNIDTVDSAGTPEHSPKSSTGSRRRKTGSLPAINVNETQRQSLKNRSVHGALSEKFTETYGYVSFPLPARSPPDGDNDTGTCDRTSPTGSDTATSNVENSEAARRRSLPAVPEENAVPVYPAGRQMSDPTSHMKRHRQDNTPVPEDEGTVQLSAALDKLGTLRRAIGSFLYTHTGRNPTSDEEVLSMLEALSTALKE